MKKLYPFEATFFKSKLNWISYDLILSADLPSRVDFKSLGNLSFQAPDFERFPCIRLAYNSLDKTKTHELRIN